MQERRVDYRKALQFVAAALEKAGAAQGAARDMADVIVTADLFGIQTHGLECLPWYLKAIKEGRLDPKAKPEILRQSPLYALVDAHNALGHATAVFGMKTAIEKARISGIGICVVRNGSHFGFAGYYPLMAIREKMLGFATSNSTPCMVPSGAMETKIGSNPISAGMPAAPYPFLIDISTCAVAGGKIDLYASTGRPLDPSWTLGADGKPGVDGKKVLDDMHRGLGGIQPMGGHKGYGLGLLAEVLTGILAGGKTSDQLHGGQPEGDQFSHMFVAMDYGMFGEKDSLEKAFSEYLDRIRIAKRLNPDVEILIPGEREFKTAIDRRGNGIKLLDATAQKLSEMVSEFGIATDDYLKAIG